ncbi:hypothetical protein D3C73_1567250 [compost metagenome]
MASLDTHESPRNQAELEQRLTRLKSLLSESDASAVSALEELRRLSLEPGLAARLAQVAEQIALFDFDRALELLQDE